MITVFILSYLGGLGINKIQNKVIIILFIFVASLELVTFNSKFIRLSNIPTHNFDKKLVGQSLPFLKEEMNIRVEYCNSKPIGIFLPEQVEAIIDQAEASMKGQTAAASYKPATLENGIRIMVPPFIESGEKIIINTDDFSYVSRSKN